MKRSRVLLWAIAPPAGVAAVALYVWVMAPAFSAECCERGLRREAVGDFATAISEFDRALLLDPANIPALVGRGWAKLHLGRAGEALSDFNKAVALDPKNGRAYAGLGMAKIALDQAQDAQADLVTAQELPGDRALAHYGLGSVKLKKGDAAAGESFQKSHSTGERAEALLEFGILRNDPAYVSRAAAIAALQLELHPNHPVGLRIRDRASAYLASHPDPLPELTGAIEANPSDPEGYLKRAEHYKSRGLMQEARSDARRALSVAPYDWAKRKLVEDWSCE